MIRTTRYLLQKDIQNINNTCRNLKIFDIIKKQKEEITKLKNIIEKQEQVINKTIQQNNSLYNQLQKFYYRPNSFDD